VVSLSLKIGGWGVGVEAEGRRDTARLRELRPLARMAQPSSILPDTAKVVTLYEGPMALLRSFTL